MTDVPKIKRPVSVWLTQALLLILILLIVAAIIAVIKENTVEISFYQLLLDDPWIILDNLSGVFVILALVISFLGLYYRKKFGLYLSISALLLLIFLFLVVYFNDNEVLTAFSTGDIENAIILTIGISVIIIPLTVLSLILTFSKKVKMFFASEISTSKSMQEPPPPPEFHRD